MKNDRLARVILASAALFAAFGLTACDWGGGDEPERGIGRREREPEHHHYDWDHGYDRHDHDRGGRDHDRGGRDHDRGGRDHDHDRGHHRDRAELTAAPAESGDQKVVAAESRTEKILASLNDKSSGQLFDGSR